MQFLLIITCLIQLSADGWTEFTPPADSRSVYVSSSTGSDMNSGLTLELPLRTIRHARTKLRSGSADRLLLRSGDVFREGTISWEIRGRSETEPLLITGYGDGPRPVLVETALSYYWNANFPTDFSLDHVSVIGLEFRGNYAVNPAGANGTGVLLSGPMRGILFEDNLFSGYDSGVNVQVRQQPDDATTVFRFRRNAVVDNETFGLLVSGGSGVVLEENLFDHNGHGGKGPTFLKHNIYLKDVRNAVISGNIISRGGNFGTKLSSDNPGAFTDFVIENNLYYNNGIGMDHSAGATGDEFTTFTHERGTVRDNVFTESGRTFSNGVKQDLVGWLLNTKDVQWTGNLFIHKSQFITGVILNWGRHHKSITVSDNVVHNWHIQDGLTDSSYLEHKASAVIDGATFERNKVNRPADEYHDASRTVASYFACIGGESDAVTFLTEARTVSKANWNAAFSAAAVNDYLRQGFTEKAAEPEPQPEPITREQKLLNDIRALLNAYEAGAN